MDLRAIGGAPESALDERVAAGLPSAAAPAPWKCRCDAIVWSSRPSRAAAALTGRHLAVFGALLAYHASPVGGYREVLGVVGGLSRGRPCGTVPFIAVDSPASLVGGRLNWALPKVLAEFTGEPAGHSMTATGDGWTITASARPLGPAVPAPLAGQLVQPWPDGTRRAAGLTGRASVQPVLVRVSVRSSGTLAG